MKARIVIGANYGDEGKGTVVAKYTKESNNVLNVLTNGGAQRGHSILTQYGSVTFSHFGSGTYYGADTFYSRFFILNPMKFADEYKKLIVKPKEIYRDINCRWSTPYDAIANIIMEENKKRKASCGMGIWNTIKRYNETPCIRFDEFIRTYLNWNYLIEIKSYYEKTIDIPEKWKNIWNSSFLTENFINDCIFMYKHTKPVDETKDLIKYDDVIFENGQGLLLSDTGKDTFDTTPSNTGILYAKEIANKMGITDITAHYVTRPYLTRHGDGEMENQSLRKSLSVNILEDRTNKYNNMQGEFRYGNLDIGNLKQRITEDAGEIPFVLEVTHCDEMDRINEFKRMFGNINAIDSPFV